MSNFLPDLPWYTWTVLTALALVFAGILRVMLAGISQAICFLFNAAWWAVLRFLASYVSYGTAHFARRGELRRAGVFNDTGIALGLWKQQTVREPSGGHIVLFGPPRSRKSWGLIMPCITSYQGSIVVNDLRGELWERTHDAREQRGPTYLFAPLSAVSSSINVFDLVRWGTLDEFGDLDRLITHLLAPPPGEASSPFAIAAKPLLIAIALDRWLHADGSLPGVVRWMTSPDLDLEAKLVTLLASPHPIVSGGARRTLDQSERLRASVWNAALAPLTVFSDPIVAQHTEKSDVLLTDLHYGVDPVTLYLAVDFGNVARMQVLLNALVECLVALLGSPASPPRHKVLLVLDEVANLGYLPELERAVSYLQGSGTQCLMAFQNINQVVRTYGPDSPILSAIGTSVFYRPHDIATAEWIRGYLGDATVTARSLTQGRTAEGPTTSQTIAEHQRDLLTTDEIRRLGRDEALILVEGTAAIRAAKLGAQPPTTNAHQLQAMLWPWRWALGGVSIACLVTLALWPVFRSRPPLPITANAAPAFSQGVNVLGFQPTPLPVNPSPAIPPPATPWTMYTRQSDNTQEIFRIAMSRHPTQDACLVAIRGQFNATWARLQTVPIRLDATTFEWFENATTSRALRYHAWCSNAPDSAPLSTPSFFPAGKGQPLPQ